MTDKNELNEITARALGWEECESSHGNRVYCHPNNIHILSSVDDWQPTENAEQAMMCLEWLTSKMKFDTAIHYIPDYKEWTIQLPHRNRQASGKTLNIAICEAVKKEMENI